MHRITYAIIFLQLLLFNVLLPGHTRGAVTLNGSSPEAKACCKVDHANPKHVPSAEDKRCCAVCYVMGTLLPGAPMMLTIQPLGLLCTVQPTAPPTVALPVRFTPKDSRGPPIF